MTPIEFIAKWRASELKESSAAQEHFIDLCRLLGEPTPAEADPTGERYCFERGARKDTGGDGWADVWKRGCFAWEYKGKHADLDAAFNQLRQYALALENPPLLIVSDMARFRIRTNWTNSVSETHEFALGDLADAGTRDKLKWAMSDPERLRPGETRQMVTERAAATFAELAQSLRDRGHDPQAVAHFVNRLVFCMFAEDVGLLPDDMFTKMLEQARRRPAGFAAMAERPVRRDGGAGRAGRLRAGGVVQRRAVRRRCRPAAGTGRDRDGPQGGGARLVGDRPVDPGHAVREGARPGQALAARGALHRPGQDHADRRSGRSSVPCSRNGRSRRRRSPPPSRRRTRRGRFAGAAGGVR